MVDLAHTLTPLLPGNPPIIRWIADVERSSGELHLIWESTMTCAQRAWAVHDEWVAGLDEMQENFPPRARHQSGQRADPVAGTGCVETAPDRL
ncbi:hypothetical protein ACQP1G_30690 [Nocardia sp. CA-107356]|uniref:hypothetical protein n=1 Tax=Nocardia sp. CA-107356 TaxID=3239972 RepID=UPI003D8F40DD